MVKTLPINFVVADDTTKRFENVENLMYNEIKVGQWKIGALEDNVMKDIRQVITIAISQEFGTTLKSENEILTYVNAG